MRGSVVALFLLLGVVTAVSSTVAAFATAGKGSACTDASETDESSEPKDISQLFQRVLLRGSFTKAPAGR